MIREIRSQIRIHRRGRPWLWMAAVALLLTSMTGTAAARPGDLDPSFGDRGLLVTPVRERNVEVGILRQPGRLGAVVATDDMPGGRVVVAGERTVAVLRRDGKIDRRFGNNGHVDLPVAGEGQTLIKDVTVDAGGRILVLAASRFAKGGGVAMVTKLSGGGKFDTSFGDDGILLTDFGLPAPQIVDPHGPTGTPVDVLPEDFAIDGQGRLVVAGTTVAAIAPCRDAGEQPHHSAFLARLLTDGNLDAGFGKGGVMLDQREPVNLEQHPSMGGVAVHGGAIYYATDQNDGANCEGFGGGLLLRLDESGGRDPSFGSAGLLGITPPESRARQIAVDRRGRIVVLRDASLTETQYGPGFEVLSRWNADGTLDTGFGRNGEVAIRLPGEGSSVDALAVDPRGRPLLAGRVSPVFAGRVSPRFILVRLTAHGRPDHSFGKHGRISTPFPGVRASATDIAIRGKRAIVAGPTLGNRLGSGQGFALARYRLDR